MKIPSIFDREPDFVNELGVKWWKDEWFTNYAHKQNAKGVSLDWTCFYVLLPDGTKEILLINQDRQIVYKHTSIEAIGDYIDIQKFLKLDKLKEKENGRKNTFTD